MVIKIKERKEKMLKQREIQKKYGVSNVPAVTSLSPNKGIMGGPA